MGRSHAVLRFVIHVLIDQQGDVIWIDTAERSVKAGVCSASNQDLCYASLRPCILASLSPVKQHHSVVYPIETPESAD